MIGRKNITTVLWAVFAVLLWVVFNPGVGSPDLTYLMGNVWSGMDATNHAPVFNWLFMKSMMTLFLYPEVVCLVHALLVTGSLVMLCREATGRRYVGDAVLALLLVVTPLVFFLLDHEKDYALMGCMAVMLTGGIRMEKGENGGFWLFWAGAMLSLLWRHNTIAVFPVIAAVALSYRGLRIRSAVIIPLVLTIWYGVNHWVLHTDQHPERQIKALEVFGVVTLRPEAKQSFPGIFQHVDESNFKTNYTFCHLQRLYEFSDYNFLQSGRSGFYAPKDQRWEKETVLTREWPGVFAYPKELAATHLYGFANSYFGRYDKILPRERDVFMKFMFGHPVPMRTNPVFDGVRMRITSFYHRMFEGRITFWIMGNPVWINLTGVLLLIWLACRRDSRFRLFAVPVLYPFTFVLAPVFITTRFYWPSAILILCLIPVLFRKEILK